MNQGQPVGTLSQEEIIKALGEQGESTLVENAMDKNLLYLDAAISLEEGLKQLQLSKKSLALVTAQNALLGAVDAQNIAEFLMIKNAQSRK